MNHPTSSYFVFKKAINGGMESSSGATTRNWTEALEDLVHDGKVDQAISFLESTVCNLEKELEKEEFQSKNGGKSSSATANQLSTALKDLSRLYSASGYSLKADQTFSRALEIKLKNGGLPTEKESQIEATRIAQHGRDEGYSNLHNEGTQESCEEDDWEALADCPADELLPQQALPGVSKLSLEDSETQNTNRRGRGPFSYKKQGLYSDNQADQPFIDDSEDNPVNPAENLEKRNLMYGTRHVLVLANFPPSIRTTDLEKLFEKFKDSFVIRWVNDTTALAVFSTPSIAIEASNSIQWSFSIRVLNDDDQILSIIPPKDLEPPRKRPPTSARTAQRMIAHGIGMKLPSTFGSAELKEQEEARRNRIVSRQNMRDDAWGHADDDNVN